MNTRIHIILDDAEKERFRRQAEREGKSLAAWLREAARERLAATDHRTELRTLKQLRAFFDACDRHETRSEPDWEEHRKVIGRSIGTAASET